MEKGAHAREGRQKRAKGLLEAAKLQAGEFQRFDWGLGAAWDGIRGAS